MLWLASKYFHKSSNRSRTHPTPMVFLALAFLESLNCVWIAPRQGSLKWQTLCVVSFPDSFSLVFNILLRVALTICWGFAFLLNHAALEGHGFYLLDPRRTTTSDPWRGSSKQLSTEQPAPDLQLRFHGKASPPPRPPAVSPLELLLHSGRFSNYYV